MVWSDGVYCAKAHRYESGFPLGGGPYVRLTIWRVDQGTERNWKDFQRIKNEIVGDEWEGVELYPAESRLVDVGNRYHIYCVPKGVLKFGWHTRKTLDSPD